MLRPFLVGYWTVKATEAEWERVPDVPVIITVAIPRRNSSHDSE
ncbi:MAG TPA: hypothetical protein VKH15_10720 [Candidatus Acidoferrum sp.]|nr:hypothetical protein [Candidatus Acidoferrum sp.]